MCDMKRGGKNKIEFLEVNMAVGGVWHKKGGLRYSCMMSECNYWMCLGGCAQGGSSEKGVPYRAQCSSAVEIGGFLLQMDVQGFNCFSSWVVGLHMLDCRCLPVHLVLLGPCNPLFFMSYTTYCHIYTTYCHIYLQKISPPFYVTHHPLLLSSLIAHSRAANSSLSQSHHS